MTLEDALGHPITDLEDVIMAQAMFGFVKHGHPDHDTAEEAAQAKLDAMSNTEFLSVLSFGLIRMRERKLI